MLHFLCSASYHRYFFRNCINFSPKSNFANQDTRYLRKQITKLSKSLKVPFKNKCTNHFRHLTVFEQIQCLALFFVSIKHVTKLQSPYKKITNWSLVYKLEKYCLAYEIKFRKSFQNFPYSGHLIIEKKIFWNQKQLFQNGSTVLVIK